MKSILKTINNTIDYLERKNLGKLGNEIYIDLLDSKKQIEKTIKN